MLDRVVVLALLVIRTGEPVMNRGILWRQIKRSREPLHGISVSARIKIGPRSLNRLFLGRPGRRGIQKQQHQQNAEHNFVLL